MNCPKAIDEANLQSTHPQREAAESTSYGENPRRHAPTRLAANEESI